MWSVHRQIWFFHLLNPVMQQLLCHSVQERKFWRESDVNVYPLFTARMCSRLELLFASLSQQSHVYTMLWCRDIGIGKWLLGHSVWLLGSDFVAANDDAPKAAYQYKWYKPSPMPLRHSDLKMYLFWFGLLKEVTHSLRYSDLQRYLSPCFNGSLLGGC